MKTTAALAALDSQQTSSQFTVVTFVSTYGFYLGLPIYSTIESTIPVTPSTTSTQSSTTITSTTTPTCRRCSLVSVTETGLDTVSQSVQTTTAHDASTTAGALAPAGQGAPAANLLRQSSGLSKGAIAAAVIVPILAILALIAGILFCLRRRKQRGAKQAGGDDGPSREMAGAGPPTLNHIVPGVAAGESDCPETPRSTRFFGHPHRGSSSNPRKSALATPRGATPTQKGSTNLPSIMAVSEPPRDPFATPTPTPGSTVYNSPEDGPRYLAGAANDSTPSRAGDSNQPGTGAVGRHWHSTNGTSHSSHGRESRQKHDGESRPTSAQDTISDLGSDDDVEIGQATVALGRGQRASVIDMNQGGHSGSPPRGSPM